MGFSLPHILLLAVVAALLLGGGRFSALMGDVAKGVKNFKIGMLDDDAPTTPQPMRPIPPPIEERDSCDRGGRR